MAEALEGLIERLRSNAPLPLCPFDSRSPLYWTTPDDATCHFCGQLPDGPDRCRGADTRVMDQAAGIPVVKITGSACLLKPEDVQ